jgi:two-component system nitrate/nitrite sensor histidine kinase NarQ
VREAVLNAIKHAQASEITVSCVTSTDGTHSVNIRDNGIGIGEASEPPGHYGLNIMRERAGSWAARCTFLSRRMAERRSA